MSNLRNRIREAREGKGLSQDDLAKMLSVDQATISNIENGKIRLVSKHFLPLAKFLGLQLFSSSGQQSDEVVLQGTLVPLWPQSIAAGFASTEEKAKVKAAEQYVMSFKPHPESPIGMTLEDESMSPRFSKGDILIADPPAGEIEIGKFVIASQGDSPRALFRQFASRGSDDNGNPQFELIPLNPLYPVLQSKRDRLVIMGVVSERHEVDL